MKKTLFALFVSMFMVGCKSNDAFQPIEYQPFDSNSSYALNIANQTVLTKPEERGLKSIKTPLRDFTQEEVKKMRTSLKHQSGGDASLFFGTARILTGDFIGILNIAGGAAAEMAHSDHLATRPRIIVELDAKKIPSKIDAEKYIIDTVNLATEKTFLRYGKIKKEKDDRNKYQTSTLVVGKNEYIVGQLEKLNELDGKLIDKRTVSLNGEVGDFYTFGVVRDNTLSKNVLIMPPTPLVLSASTEYWSLSDFYKEFTSNLPEGFYVYIPSFNKLRYDGKIYWDTKNVVPAIYTKGEEFLFVKP